MIALSTSTLPTSQPQTVEPPLAVLARLMESHPCYVFVANDDCSGARALFRGRWTWQTVEKYLTATPSTVVISDERASGFVRYRLYAVVQGSPSCLAEVEVYFARQERTSFWCDAETQAGALKFAA